MATKSLIIVIDIEDDGDVHVPMPSDQDLAEGIVARLDEFYPTDEVTAVPSNHRVAVTDPDAVKAILVAAGVGLEGAEDAGALDPLDVAHGWDAVHELSMHPHTKG